MFKGVDLGKILIVDDVKAIREIVIFFLETFANAHVLEAENGVDAIAKIRSHPDLKAVICDYEMAPGNGFDVYKELRKGSNIPFLLHSSGKLEQYKEFTQANNFFYLPKPLDLETFKNSLLEGYADPSLLFEEQTNEYCRIHMSLLKLVKMAPVDLYVFISNDKFAIAHRSGSALTEMDFKKYLAKNILFLYVKKSEVQNFLVDYQKTIAATIDKPKAA